MIKNYREFRRMERKLNSLLCQRDGYKFTLSRAPHRTDLCSKIEELEGAIAVLNTDITHFQLPFFRLSGSIDLSVIDEIPELLIKARILAGLSPSEFAAKIGKTKQQIYRYEKTRYQSASLSQLKILKIALENAVYARLKK